MVLFFGDSIISAENNNFNGIVEKLNNKECINLGVSGTCIGNYSLYPVGNNNFIDLLYKEEKRIKDADTIFIEYGSNDISSVILNYTTINNVLIELNKILDFIKQVNPKVKIYFITLGKNKYTFCSGQIDYLRNDYLKDINELVFSNLSNRDLYSKWLENYDLFEEYVKRMIKNVIELPFLDSFNLDKDNMHPNDLGYEKISKIIKGVIDEK